VVPLELADLLRLDARSLTFLLLLLNLLILIWPLLVLFYLILVVFDRGDLSTLNLQFDLFPLLGDLLDFI